MPSKYRRQRERQRFRARTRGWYFRFLEHIEVLLSVTYHQGEFINPLSNQICQDLFDYRRGPSFVEEPYCWSAREEVARHEINFVISQGWTPGVLPSTRI